MGSRRPAHAGSARRRNERDDVAAGVLGHVHVLGGPLEPPIVDAGDTAKLHFILLPFDAAMQDVPLVVLGRDSPP